MEPLKGINWTAWSVRLLLTTISAYHIGVAEGPAGWHLPDQQFVAQQSVHVQLATLEQDMVVVKQLSIMLNVCIAN